MFRCGGGPIGSPKRFSDTRRMGKPNACPLSADGEQCHRRGPHKLHGYVTEGQESSMGIRWVIWSTEDPTPRPFLEVVGRPPE